MRQPARDQGTPAPPSRATPRSFLARLEQRPWPSVIVALAVLVISAIAMATEVRAGDEDCYPIDVTPFSPSDVAGCMLDGPTAGVASTYPGGLTLIVPVAMYGDLYTNTPEERLIDLTRGQVVALGLDPADGLFEVTVTPIEPAGLGTRSESAAAGGGAGGGAVIPPAAVLPDTAVAP